MSQTKFRYRDALFSTTSAKYHRPSEHGDCGGRGRTLGGGWGRDLGGGGGGPKGGRGGAPPLIPRATTLKEGGGAGTKMVDGEVGGGGGPPPPHPHLKSWVSDLLRCGTLFFPGSFLTR